ncbi:MAG TPA: porin [Steroidobacteraceae bacterium]|nr:porin [Steroidobacteraceae bacterium]
MLRSLVAVLAAVLIVFSYSGPTVAQSTDADTQARMRSLQQQLDELQKQLQSLKDQQAKAAADQQKIAADQQKMAADQQKVVAESAKTAKTVSTTGKAFDTFMKGFFGTFDVSIDYTTKGMNGFVAYPYSLAPGVTSPTGPFVVSGPAKGGGAGPYGRVGWLAAMSSNGSNIGYRGTHEIGNSRVDFIYQVSTSLNMAAAPGLQNTWTKSSNTVQGAIGLGDTYVGFQEKEWGKLKFGEMYMPYKTATDRLNPFSGTLGDYSVIMGNTGGDNRVEFGTRMDHVIMYNSPTWSGFSFDAAYSLGQNVDPNNDLTSEGSPDCSGGNNPGSGNLFLNCDDGGFNYAYSGDLKFETGGLYLTAAYELHSGVNRSSDGIGANNPYYAYLFGLGPNNALSAQLLDWSDYLAFQGEYPGAAAAGSPGYNTNVDVVNEWAMKFGGQYHFDFGLTISYIYEDLHRSLGQAMEFQNERQRTGDWLAAEYVFNGGADRVALGWAHAGASVGDPGGQHNYNPYWFGNQANMYTFGWWHKLDKQLTAYLNFAETANDGNAHYDIGAGGHGIKTDCHDATHNQFVDYSSAGPTTWGGCHPLGVSTGINFKF